MDEDLQEFEVVYRVPMEKVALVMAGSEEEACAVMELRDEDLVRFDTEIEAIVDDIEIMRVTLIEEVEA